VKPLHRTLVNVASVLVGLAAVFTSLVYVNQPDEPPRAEAPAGAQAPREAAPPSATPSAAPSGAVTLTVADLATFDGKNGKQCYVAVDKTVYLIEGKTLWQEGEHLPSNGQAMCGKDLTSVIDKSPHGRSKLPLLTVVGQLR
jgi:predicted heme/steroid binding protein